MVNYDPIIALDGGQDGLKFYKHIAKNVKNYLLEDGVLLLEIGYNQGDAVATLFKDVAKDVEIVKDYNNNDRVVIVKF